MTSAARRALSTFGLGIGLIALGVTMLRFATLTQNWFLVFLAMPAFFIGVVRAAEGVPKRTTHRTLYNEY